MIQIEADCSGQSVTSPLDGTLHRAARYGLVHVHLLVRVAALCSFPSQLPMMRKKKRKMEKKMMREKHRT